MTEARIYLRLSDLRAEDADSFGAREAVLRGAADQLGWHVPAGEAGLIIEKDTDRQGRRKGVSAYKEKLVEVRLPGGGTGKRWRVQRDGWTDRLLPGLEAGEFQAVIAERVDRLTRRVHDMGDLIDVARVAGASVAVLSPAGKPRLLLTMGGDSDEWSAARALAQQAEDESAKKVTMGKDGRRRAHARGSYGGGRRLYGYQLAPGSGHYQRALIPDLVEAAAVKRMAGWVQQGWTVAAVARQLNADGVLTVMGGPWTAEKVRGVLSKPLLAGLVTLNGEQRRAFWAEDGGAILDESTWRAVVAKLNSDTISYVKKDGTEVTVKRERGHGNVPRHLLSGIARCCCGGRIAVRGGRARQPGYVCTEHDGKAGPGLRRSVAHTDAYVLAEVAETLTADPGILRPAPVAGLDLAALLAEEDRLE